MTKPLKIALVGGSNSVIRTGYISHVQGFMRRAGYECQILNLAIGANNCLRGLMTANTMDAEVDVIVCEYFVNDFSFVNRTGLEEWFGTYEAMVRTLRRRYPQAVIDLPLIGRRDVRYREIQDQMRRRLNKLAEAYSLVVTDIDALLLSLEDQPMSDFYADSSHLKAGIASSHAGAMIAADISLALARGTRHVEVPLIPLSRFDLEGVTTREINEFKELAARLVTFRNSRYDLQALRLADGESVEIALEGRPLSLGYVTTAESCDLVCEKASGERVRFHTAHTEVLGGRFKFLLRTASLMTGDWYDSANSGHVILRAMRFDGGRGISRQAEYGMVANKSTDPQFAYVTSFLQLH